MPDKIESRIHPGNPRVYLVTEPNFNVDAFFTFLHDEGIEKPGIISNPEKDVSAIPEAAARLCYMSYGKGRTNIQSFLSNLLQSKHGSIFEHVNYGFIIAGVSRSLTHELIRHRAGFAYSQLSQRYVDSSRLEVVVPPLLDDNATDKAQYIWIEGVKDIFHAYNQLVSELDELLPPATNFAENTKRRKQLRETSRALFPNAVETKIFVTGNVRAWRHFIELRASIHADVEIRRLAMRILDILKEKAPLLFGDFEIEFLPDGTQGASTKYSKV